MVPQPGCIDIQPAVSTTQNLRIRTLQDLTSTKQIFAQSGGDARTVGSNDGHRLSADYGHGQREQER
jgi:hypothetical protein